MIRSLCRKFACQLYFLVSGKPGYELRYKNAQLMARFKALDDCHDFTFIAPPEGAPSWILNAICEEIDSRFDGDSVTISSGQAQTYPKARAYFFSHYAYFRQALLKQGHVKKGKTLVFFTHPQQLDCSEEELIFALNQSDYVVSMCHLFADQLVSRGVEKERVVVATIGADPQFFPTHQRGSRCVGFCTAFYERKNPDRILNIVAAMPDVQFKLLGKNWAQWKKFAELQSQPNFEYLERAYADYPAFYQSLDVFVSPAQLEGGPVPLVEAMMSNCVPVASKTGLAPDVISHGKNGFLFEVEATADVISDFVRKALDAPFEVRSSVEQLSWDRFSDQIQELAGFKKSRLHNG